MLTPPPGRSLADELAHALAVILSLYESAKSANDSGWQSDKDAAVKSALQALQAWEASRS